MRACFLSLLCLPLLLVIRSGVFGPESRFTLGTRLIMMSDVCIHMHDCVFDGVVSCNGVGTHYLAGPVPFWYSL